MGKATLRTIADRAGVGTATVERVLNERGGVRPETAARVLVAARELNWKGRFPELHRGVLRIEVILVRPDSSFFARLANAFRRIAASLDKIVQLHITFVAEKDTEEIVCRIRSSEYPRNALAIAVPDRPQVRAALQVELKAGLPIVQIVTRTIEDADFVGIDNYAAGRTAALMVSQMNRSPGPVVALCHSAHYQVHRERIRGFSDFLETRAQGSISFLFIAFGADDRRLSARRISEMLEEWPDLAAVYNAGGANHSVLDHLARLKRHVFFVGHELSDVTTSALKSGRADIILDQVPEAQARRATDILLSRLRLTDILIENPPIRFNTITTESV